MNVKLASGHVIIDPPSPAQLAGYPDRVENWTAIHDSLEANVVLLRTDETVVVLVSLDLLYCGARLRKAILTRCPEVAPEALIIGASHTHFAPATSDDQPLLGKAQDTYVEMCATRISSLIQQLLAKDGEAACMDFRLTEPLRSANRRRPVRRLSAGLRIRNEIVFRPNPDGEVDPKGRVVTFSSAKDRRPLAVIWGWSCHPVCFPRRTEVSAEYPGVVRAKAREAFGADLPVLFFQGFAGNIRPPAIGRSRLQRKEIFVPWSETEWQAWSCAIAREVAAAISRRGKALDEAVSVRIERPLSDFISSTPPERKIGFQGVRLGSDLYLLGVTAEPSVEYIGILDALLPASAHAFPIGCLDGTYGYLPTTQQSVEGGYEGAGFLPGFSLPGTLSPVIGEKAETNFRELVTALSSQKI
jgi:hypothetical protein